MLLCARHPGRRVPALLLGRPPRCRPGLWCSGSALYEVCRGAHPPRCTSSAKLWSRAPLDGGPEPRPTQSHRPCGFLRSVPSQPDRGCPPPTDAVRTRTQPRYFDSPPGLLQSARPPLRGRLPPVPRRHRGSLAGHSPGMPFPGHPRPGKGNPPRFLSPFPGFPFAFVWLAMAFPPYFKPNDDFPNGSFHAKRTLSYVESRTGGPTPSIGQRMPAGQILNRKAVSQ